MQPARGTLSLTGINILFVFISPIVGEKIESQGSTSKFLRYFAPFGQDSDHFFINAAV